MSQLQSRKEQLQNQIDRKEVELKDYQNRPQAHDLEIAID